MGEIWVYDLYNGATSRSAFRHNETMVQQLAEEDFDVYIYYFKEV